MQQSLQKFKVSPHRVYLGIIKYLRSQASMEFSVVFSLLPCIKVMQYANMTSTQIPLRNLLYISYRGSRQSLKLVNIVSVSSAACGYDIITNINESMPR